MSTATATTTTDHTLTGIDCDRPTDPANATAFAPVCACGEALPTAPTAEAADAAHIAHVAEVTATDTHGYTRASQQARADRAVRQANDQIAAAFYDGADDREPGWMREARSEWERAREYRDAIAAADLAGIEDATPTTLADLAEEYAGSAYEAATRAMD